MNIVKYWVTIPITTALNTVVIDMLILKFLRYNKHHLIIIYIQVKTLIYTQNKSNKFEN